MSVFRGRILVIRGGAIGDFILTLPAIAALRRQFPSAWLEVLGYPHIVQLAIAGGLVDHASSIEARALAGFFARGGPLAEELMDYFSGFDLILSYLYDPDRIFQTNVGLCSPAQFLVGPHRPDERAGVNAAKVYLKPLERLAIFDADSVPALRIGPAAGVSQRVGGQVSERREFVPTLVLHPGSGSDRKNWPEARWAELLEWLIRETMLKLLVIGGEAEGERLQRLAAALPPIRTRVAQSFPLAELAGLLAGCGGFVGHDSGISHLAAAVGLPGLILWGDTAEAVWRPPSAKVSVIRHPAGLERLPVARVTEEIAKILGERA
jgi:heptosyltransferase III